MSRNMAHSTHPLNANNDLLLWALVLSLALHSAAVVLLPGFTFSHTIKTVEPLTVELQQLPPPATEPDKPKPPEPPKPQPRQERVPPKVLPQRVTPPPAPAPVVVPQHNEPPPPVAAAEPPATAPSTPSVVAVEQKAAEPPPVYTAPVATPSHQATSEESLGEIRAAYGRLLRDELAKHIKYPRVAELKGWEGKVRIRLQVDNQGNVLGTPEVIETSGYKMLDDAAVKTVLNSSPLPLPPLALQGKPIPVETILNYYKAK
jgi:protein TonB